MTALIGRPATSIANTNGSSSQNGNQVSFTNVSSLSVNGVFTSSFTNYQITLYCEATTASTDVRARFMSAGVVVASTSDYNIQKWGFANGDRFSGSAHGVFTRSISTGTSSTITVFGPAASTKTTTHTFGGAGIQHLTSPCVNLFFMTYNVAQAHDGFELSPASGSITGYLQVFAYAE
jgi:hypothetical protein